MTSPNIGRAEVLVDADIDEDRLARAARKAGKRGGDKMAEGFTSQFKRAFTRAGLFGNLSAARSDFAKVFDRIRKGLDAVSAGLERSAERSRLLNRELAETSLQLQQAQEDFERLSRDGADTSKAEASVARLTERLEDLNTRLQRTTRDLKDASVQFDRLAAAGKSTEAIEKRMRALADRAADLNTQIDRTTPKLREAMDELARLKAAGADTAEVERRIVLLTERVNELTVALDDNNSKWEGFRRQGRGLAADLDRSERSLRRLRIQAVLLALVITPLKAVIATMRGVGRAFGSVTHVLSRYVILAGVILAATLPLIPVLGQLYNGLIEIGLGLVGLPALLVAAGAALGIFIAGADGLKDAFAPVRAAFAGFKKDVSDVFRTLRADFAALAREEIPAVRRGLLFLTSGFRDLMRAAIDAFRELGGGSRLEGFFRDLDAAVHNLEAAMRPLVDLMLQMITQVGDRLPGLTKRFADFLDRLNTRAKGVDFGAVFVRAVNGLVNLVAGLVDAGRALREFFMAAAGEEARNSLDPDKGPFADFRRFFTDLRVTIRENRDGIRDFFIKVGKAVSALGAAVGFLYGVLKPTIDYLRSAEFMAAFRDIQAAFGSNLAAGAGSTVQEGFGALLLALVKLIVENGPAIIDFLSDLAEVMAVLAGALAVLVPLLGPVIKFTLMLSPIVQLANGLAALKHQLSTPPQTHAFRAELRSFTGEMERTGSQMRTFTTTHATETSRFATNLRNLYTALTFDLSDFRDRMGGLWRLLTTDTDQWIRDFAASFTMTGSIGSSILRKVEGFINGILRQLNRLPGISIPLLDSTSTPSKGGGPRSQTGSNETPTAGQPVKPKPKTTRVGGPQAARSGPLLVVENLNVQSAPGEDAATAVPRGMRDLMFRLDVA